MKKSKEFKRIEKWMLREMDSNIEYYVDNAGCINMTTLAEEAFNHIYSNRASTSDVDDIFFDVAFTVAERLSDISRVM